LFGPRADIQAMTERLQLFMEQEGLPFTTGRDMIFNSRLAQELAKWGEGTARSEGAHSERLNQALYQAYFVDGLNIGEVDVLLQVVEQVGLDVEEAREVLQKRLMKTAVDADWRHALSIGVRSVPTFAVGLTGIAGAQPYEQLAQLLEQSGAVKRS
jgi:predicted DsbA family dithiol-disulfide isomerase